MHTPTARIIKEVSRCTGVSETELTTPYGRSRPGPTRQRDLAVASRQLCVWLMRKGLGLTLREIADSVGFTREAGAGFAATRVEEWRSADSAWRSLTDRLLAAVTAKFGPPAPLRQ